MTIDLDAPVFLLGMPRSGTTWLSQIFESAPQFAVRLSPPYSYRFRGRLSESSTRAEWHEVLQGAVDSDDPFMTQNWRRGSGELPDFGAGGSPPSLLAVKDTRFHQLYAAGMAMLERAKTVYIVRHPAAALWSWRSCKEFPQDADFAKEWRSGACRKKEGTGEYWGFDDWLSLTLAYRENAKAAPDRYLVVDYARLVADTRATVERLFAFCGVPLSSATENFLAESRSKFDPSPYSVFKGGEAREDWKKEFPGEILAIIESETRRAGLGDLLS